MLLFGLVALGTGYYSTSVALHRESIERQAAQKAKTLAVQEAAAARRAEGKERDARRRAEDLLWRAERETYRYALARAHADQQIHRIKQAKATLEALPSELTHWRELRGWEYDYLWHTLHAERLKLPGQHGVFLGDGQRIATLEGDGTLSMFETATGKQLGTWPTGMAKCTSLEASSDGSKLAIAAGERVLLWDVARAAPLRTLEGLGGEILSAAFDATGDRLVTAAGGVIRQEMEKAQKAFGPFAAALAANSARSYQVAIHDVATGELKKTIINQRPYVSKAIFNPDGTQVVTTSGLQPLKLGTGRGLSFWDPESAKRQRSLAVWEQVSAVAFSADGQRFAVAGVEQPGGGKIQVFQVDKTEPALEWSVDAAASSLAISSDGKRLAAALENTARLFDLQSGVALDVLADEEPIARVAFHADGSLLTVSNSGIRLWDSSATQDGRVLPYHVDGPLAISHDSRLLLTQMGKVALVDLASSGTLHQFLGKTNGVNSLAFHPAKLEVASGGGQSLPPKKLTPLAGVVAGEVSVWRVNERAEAELVHQYRVGGSVSAVVYSPDGRFLATRHYAKGGITGLEGFTNRIPQLPKILQLYRTDDYRLVKSISLPIAPRPLADPSLDLAARMAAAKSEIEGRLFVTNCTFWEELLMVVNGGRLSAFRAVDGEEAALPEALQNVSAAAILGHPRGKLFVARQDGRVEIWEASTRQRLASFDLGWQHDSRWAAHPDGRRLATCVNTEIKIWDLATGQDLLTLRGLTHSPWNMTFSPDGAYLVATSNGAVRIWQGQFRQLEQDALKPGSN